MTEMIRCKRCDTTSEIEDIVFSERFRCPKCWSFVKVDGARWMSSLIALAKKIGHPDPLHLWIPESRIH